MKIERVDVSKTYVNDLKRVLDNLRPTMSNIVDGVQGKDINSIKEIIIFKDKKKLSKHVQKDRYSEIRSVVDESDRADTHFAKRGYIFLKTSDPKSYLHDHIIIEEFIHALTEITDDERVFFDFIDLVDKKVGFHIPYVAMKLWNKSKEAVEHYYTFTLFKKYSPTRIVAQLNKDLNTKFKQISNHIRSMNHNPIIIAFYFPAFVLGDIFDIETEERIVENYRKEYERVKNALFRLSIDDLQKEGYMLIKEICEIQLSMCLGELKKTSPRFLSDSRTRTLISL
ncbi:MAG: hypothetical protein JSV20_02165 [Candidatus Bathyarchaeota archaeon]|nr:MAG: hypothetical protein JSV20_02165 [Candidatus Bathyarchaeota archaeon]